MQNPILSQFIEDLESKNTDKFFNDKQYLIEQLKILNDNFIGMQKIKEDIVGLIKSHMLNVVQNNSKNDRRHCLITGPPGVGKCLDPSTEILMYNGSIKLAKNIIEGDILMGDDSTPRNVLSTVRGEDNMYILKCRNSDSYTCNEPHILTLIGIKPYISNNIVYYTEKGFLQSKKFNQKDLAINFMEKLPDDIFDISLISFYYRTEKKYSYLFHRPIEFKDIEINFDVYTIGWWSGGGNWDINFEHKNRLDKIYINEKERNKKFYEYLENLNIIDIHEYVPPHISINSLNKRLLFLAGLVDAKAIKIKNTLFIESKKISFLKDLNFLCLSCGFKSGIIKKNKNYKLYIKGNLKRIPTIIKDLTIIKNYSFTDYIERNDDFCRETFSIVYKGRGHYCGFELDGNGRFVLGNFKITHNTQLAKIYCKIWIGVGFIKKDIKRVKDFSNLQDQLIRLKSLEIREYQKILTKIKTFVNQKIKASNLTQDTINRLITCKDSISTPLYNSLYENISDGRRTIDSIEHFINNQKVPQISYVGMGIDKENLKEDQLDDIPFHRFTRADLVGKYVGHTESLVREKLTKALGGVAYIDEAYDLCDGKSNTNDFGPKALTEINDFMEEHKDEIIIIFAGYKDKIIENLFTVQKGLESRFQQAYEIEGYNSSELTEIYINKLKEDDININIEKSDINKIIEENFEFFEYFGRDIERLAQKTKDVLSNKLYDKILEGKNIGKMSIDNIDILKDALDKYKSNILSRPNYINDTLNFLKKL